MSRSKAVIRVKAGIKAGLFIFQHNRRVAGIKVKAGIKGGKLVVQHNRALCRA